MKPHAPTTHFSNDQLVVNFVSSIFPFGAELKKITYIKSFHFIGNCFNFIL